MIRHANPLRAAGAAVALLLAAGCGTTGNDAPVYTASDEVPPIRAPDGLSAPDIDTSFEIPGYSLPELAAQGDEVQPPRVLSSAEAEQARSRIRFGPLGLYLEVDDTAASTWRRLGFALDRGDLDIEEVLDEQRRFRVRFTHEPIQVSDRGLFSKVFLFWQAPDYMDYSGTYLFEVQRESSDTTRVAILDGQGNVLPMQRAEFVLSRLRQRLG
jgi:uncharacterized lipoprotein